MKPPQLKGVRHAVDSVKFITAAAAWNWRLSWPAVLVSSATSGEGSAFSPLTVVRVSAFGTLSQDMNFITTKSKPAGTSLQAFYFVTARPPKGTK